MTNNISIKIDTIQEHLQDEVSNVCNFLEGVLILD